MPNWGDGDHRVVELKDLRRLEKLGGGALRWIALGVIALILVLMSVYTIGPEEAGVVLRFGRYVRTTDSGLHFLIPFVETKQKVPIERQLKQEFGFRTVSAGVQSQFTSRGYGGESNMLTGDLNAAVVEWVVQYRIIDPVKFLYRVRNVEGTLRDMSEAVMREVVGDRTVNEVLTVGRAEVADLVAQKLGSLCDEYQTGIKIDQVVLQDVNPPEAVKASFNEVNEAQQEKEKLINEAQAAYNKVIPRAAGEAQQTIEEAEGYAVDRVNRAQGEAERFSAVFEEYRKAPEVTRRRLYLETMGEILPKAGRKLVIDGDMKGVLPLLDMGGLTIGKQTEGGGQ